MFWKNKTLGERMSSWKISSHFMIDRFSKFSGAAAMTWLLKHYVLICWNKIHDKLLTHIFVCFFNYFLYLKLKKKYIEWNVLEMEGMHHDQSRVGQNKIGIIIFYYLHTYIFQTCLMSLCSIVSYTHKLIIIIKYSLLQKMVHSRS